MDKTVKNILIVFLLVLSFYLLTVLSSILIPLVLAYLFASLFQPLIMLLERKKVPKWLILPAVVVLTLFILFILSQIILQTTAEMNDQQEYLLSRLTLKFNALFDWINGITEKYFKTTIDLQSLGALFGGDLFSGMAAGLARSFGSFTGSFFMFALYYVVLLSSMSEYRRFIEYVGGGNRKSELLKHYESIQRSIYTYIKIKTFVSLLTGLLAMIICLAFGIKFALFWGLVTFLLNFIPTVGSIAAVIPPLIMGIIQFDTLRMMLFLAMCLIGIQVVIGNVVEPIIMSNRLRLNTLTVIFGLVFWGFLWGIWGMLLSVPLLVIFKLILEQSEEMSFFARLMSIPPENKS